MLRYISMITIATVTSYNVGHLYIDTANASSSTQQHREIYIYEAQDSTRYKISSQNYKELTSGTIIENCSLNSYQYEIEYTSDLGNVHLKTQMNNDRNHICLKIDGVLKTEELVRKGHAYPGLLTSINRPVVVTTNMHKLDFDRIRYTDDENIPFDNTGEKNYRYKLSEESYQILLGERKMKRDCDRPYYTQMISYHSDLGNVSLLLHYDDDASVAVCLKNKNKDVTTDLLENGAQSKFLLSSQGSKVRARNRSFLPVLTKVSSETE